MGNNQAFQKIKNSPAINNNDLYFLFDNLPTISESDILGKWKGGYFATQHPGNKILKEIKWFGKWYRNKLDAIPLICYDSTGKLYSSNIMRLGHASLWDVVFREKLSAAMLYDDAPIFDHFRKVDENTLMGVMCGEITDDSPEIIKNGGDYFFYLKRIAEFPVEFIE